MNYLVVNSVCCCLNLCCKQLWQSLYKIVGKQAFIKLVYLLIYFGSVIFSVIVVALMSSSWAWVLPSLAPGITCSQSQTVKHLNCLSASAVYRISLCLVVFSVCMFGLLQVCATRVGLIFNDGLFFSKFVIIIGMFIGTLYVGNQIFMGYGQVAKVLSYIFVIAQAMILIDLAYLWGIKWAKKYSLGSRRYAILLIVCTLLFFGLSIMFVVLSFTSHPATIKWADILCIFQLLIMVSVQLLNFNKQNSLLTTSCLCLLVSYCTWSAGYSHPDLVKNNSQLHQNILYFNMGVSLLLLIISTAGSIYGSTNNEEDNNKFVNLDAESIQTMQKQKQKWSQWLLYLVGMSAFLGMVVTDWGSADIVNKQFNLTMGAWTGKLAMGWTVTIMYTWSLLAPRVCPNRNFYFQ